MHAHIHRDINLGLSWDLPPGWLGFMVSKGVGKPAGKKSMVLPISKTCKQQYQPARQDMPTVSVVPGTLLLPDWI